MLPAFLPKLETLRCAIGALRRTCLAHRQSGHFTAEDTPLMRQSNATLRYDLIEAANRVKNHNPTREPSMRKRRLKRHDVSTSAL